ncbi:hypothetical protein [Roseivirga pacifica]|uniref:hypothetical protein n=1 Tax=Roseivirga pacifica TaxID=1267423 RepID=UPI00227AAF2F|nr:hypothetical protein [Roseivirga pacifica]
MTREEQVAFCRKCKNRKFDSEQGIICRITDKKADFEDECPTFELDPYVKEINHQPNHETPSHEVIKNLSDKSLDELREYQDFGSAIFGGVLVALLGAILWATITVITEFQIGFMAVGIGLIVGFSIRFFGAGVDQKFGILGALLALVSCLLGNILTQVGFVAQEENISYLLAAQLFDYSLVPLIFKETFSFMDLVFYAIAIGEGYKFAFRAISQDDLDSMKKGLFNPEPEGYKVRKYAVAASILVFAALMFVFNQGVEGKVTYKYDDGSKMSEGEYLAGKEHGLWTYWYMNGKVQLEARYNEGVPDGEWKWYYESGIPMSVNTFKNGMQHGPTYNYYNTGQISDSSSFDNGRQNGQWISYYENGQISSIGNIARDYQDGDWKSYYENGSLNSEGAYKAGEKNGLWVYWDDKEKKISETSHYETHNEFHNCWNRAGEQTLIDGNGTYYQYYESGNTLQYGAVKNGRQSGKWITFYEDGNKMEEGIYQNDEYKILNTWKPNGSIGIKNGNGLYELYNNTGLLVLESGQVIDGLRSGEWTSTHETTGITSTKVNYLKGKLNGSYSSYSEGGNLLASGNLINNKRTGEWKWTYDSGELECTVTYVDGKKEGIQPFYGYDGELIREEFYKEGQLVDEKIY